MNAIQRRQYQMLLRLREFGNTNRELFATSTVAQEAFGSLNAAVNELTVSDLLKMTASASARGSRKKEARKALLEVMVRVITDLSTRLETALRDRGMNQADRTAANTRINDVLSAVLLNVRRLDLIVDSELAGNNALRAVWKQARRIEAARGPRNGGAADTEQPPAPSPTPSPAPAEAVEPEVPTAERAEPPASEAEAPKPATVIEMPLRVVA